MWNATDGHPAIMVESFLRTYHCIAACYKALCGAHLMQSLFVGILTCKSRHLCYNHITSNLYRSVYQGQSSMAGRRRIISLHINAGPETISPCVSVHTWTLCLLVSYADIFFNYFGPRSGTFCKQFGHRSDPQLCRAWSGSKLFDKLNGTNVFLKEFHEKFIQKI